MSNASPMRWILSLLVLVVVLLHQDTWFWNSKAAVFGFLPIGLAYHAAFTLLCSLTMWTLILYVWPEDLERDAEEETPAAVPSPNGAAG